MNKKSRKSLSLVVLFILVCFSFFAGWGLQYFYSPDMKYASGWYDAVEYMQAKGSLAGCGLSYPADGGYCKCVANVKFDFDKYAFACKWQKPSFDFKESWEK